MAVRAVARVEVVLAIARGVGGFKESAKLLSQIQRYKGSKTFPYMQVFSEKISTFFTDTKLRTKSEKSKEMASSLYAIYYVIYKKI